MYPAAQLGHVLDGVAQFITPRQFPFKSKEVPKKHYSHFPF